MMTWNNDNFPKNITDLPDDQFDILLRLLEEDLATVPQRDTRIVADLIINTVTPSRNVVEGPVIARGTPDGKGLRERNINFVRKLDDISDGFPWWCILNDEYEVQWDDHLAPINEGDGYSLTEPQKKRLHELATTFIAIIDL